jgi:hypothetical protein
MPIVHAKEANTVTKIKYRNVGVFHCVSPALHASSPEFEL